MIFTQADLLAMSLEDLKSLNTRIVTTIKEKRRQTGQTIASELKVNQEIKVRNTQHANDIFIIQKINKTKAKCLLKGTLKGYNIPFNIILTKW
jgi:sRNA-binding protein